MLRSLKPCCIVSITNFSENPTDAKLLIHCCAFTHLWLACLHSSYLLSLPTQWVVSELLHSSANYVLLLFIYVNFLFRSISWYPPVSEYMLHIISYCVINDRVLVWWQNGAELVKRIKAVYCIKVLRGDKVGTWVIDVKNGTGSVKYDPAGIN